MSSHPIYDEEAVLSSPATAVAPELYPEKTTTATQEGLSSLNENANLPKIEVTAEKLRNPLHGIPRDQLISDVEAFAHIKGLTDDVEILKKGAILAQDPKGFEKMELAGAEVYFLRRETTHRWNQPWMMYFMAILCGGSAIVQGMDQTAVNGAQIYYFEQFGVTDVWIQGLINGAPYICCSLIGCWTTRPLNQYLGRRGCIFVSCLLAIIAAVWQAIANSWWNLFLARFFLGLAIGAKSTTTPVYAAECAPANIRGALTMMWQMWTAFGIMLGFVASVAFMNLQHPTIPYLQWRLMLASTGIPPIIVCAQVFFCPESPRWYMLRNNYPAAFKSLCRLRNSHLQAARDLYLIHTYLQLENSMSAGKNLWKEFFVVPRNRRAAQSSVFVMFMQQFCGVNVIAYYSSQIFTDAGFSVTNALLASMGAGIINWIFALPAVYTIDTFGRRSLLLVGYPLMGLCLLFTGFSFFIPVEAAVARIACIATGIYLFMIIYSPTSGPVPFVYSAEAFPLYVREIGMSFATSVCWGFNFVLSLTWPALVKTFKPQGAFAWYAAWNFAATAICWFCLPETKALELEELDQVFSVPTTVMAKHYYGVAGWHWRKYVLRKDVEPKVALHEKTF